MKTKYFISMQTNERKQKYLNVEPYDRPSSALSTCSEPVKSGVKPRTCTQCSDRRSSLPLTVHSNIDISQQTDVSYDSGLRGNVISSFYNMWRHSKHPRPLGRGKVELPNSMKLHDKYRECGCVSRLHIRQCRVGGCCSAH